MWIKVKKFLLDLLFPVNCLGCGQKNFLICQDCLNKIPLSMPLIQTDFCRQINRVLIALDYRHPLVKKAIKTLKYPPYAHYLSKDLGELLIKYLKKCDSVLKIISYLTENNFVLIPIPICRRKLSVRGFNQSELIAKELSREFNWPLNLKLLKKIKDNRSQTNLNPQQRKANVKNAFAINQSLKTDFPKNIILIDDILTTGATLEEAGKTLRRTGVEKIWAIVLAKG